MNKEVYTAPSAEIMILDSEDVVLISTDTEHTGTLVTDHWY